MSDQVYTVEGSMAEVGEGFDKLRAGERFKQEALRNIRVWLSEDEYKPYRGQILDLVERKDYRILLDSFYQVIPFGTGGRRGPVGVGPNRINLRTIGESAQALASYLIKAKGANTKIKAVIAYDTRHYSREFAVRTAEVFAGNGIFVYIFDDIRSTPELSFAIRSLQSDIGVVISASHNPPTDNGFKAYWADGGQILPPHDQNIIDMVSQTKEIKRLSMDEDRTQGLVRWIGSEIDEKYLSAVCEEALISRELTSKADTNVHIVYTPLHGTGITSVLPVLRRLGYRVDIVEEQGKPDGDFSGVKGNIPNPEAPAALELAIEKARDIGADVVLASDPDADRIGVAVPLSSDKTEWIALTGNQIASLLTHFTLEQLQKRNALPKDGLVVKTRVTTDLMMDICSSFDISTIGDLLVGFKYIAEIVNEYPERFILGAEESHGFLKGSYTRDKDSAIGAVLMAELTGYMKKRGKTPYQLLDDLYKKHGYYKDIVEFTLLEGAEGRRQIEQIMHELRANPPIEIGGLNIVEIHDYLHGKVRQVSSGEERPLDGPEGDFLVYTLSQDGRTRLAARPSGTEPKIKYYVSVYSKTAIEEDMRRTDALAAAIVQDIVSRTSNVKS